MKNALLILLCGCIYTAIALSVSACMTTKTPVGNYKEQPGTEYTYDKAKQIYIFWGCIPVGRATAETPDSMACEIVTRRNFTDVLITCFTGGIISTYTIKVNAKQ